MLTLLYLSISVYLLATVALKFANFHYVSEIYESMDEYKIPVENPSSQELFNTWKKSLDADQLDNFEKTLNLFHVNSQISISSEELCQAWINSLNQDFLELEGIDNIDHLLKVSKDSDNYLPF